MILYFIFISYLKHIFMIKDEIWYYWYFEWFKVEENFEIEILKISKNSSIIFFHL